MPIFIVGIDYLVTIFFSNGGITDTTETSKTPLLIILPFRDEATTLPKSLPPILDYVKSNPESRVLLVDSNSSDNSHEVAREILYDHGNVNSDQHIIISSTGGKCTALNLAMDSRKSGEQVMVVDSDVIVSSPGIEALRRVLMDDSIGSVSGLELIEKDSSGFSRSYKSRINKSREIKSPDESSIVLEGSMLMFDPDRIGWSSFDESINADDAQISVSSILSGHKSIVSGEAKFKQISRKQSFSFQQSVRRGQGVSSVLIRNSRLFRVRGMFRETLRNWLIYIFVQWGLAIVSSIAIYSVLEGLGGGLNSPMELINAVFLFVLLTFPDGRTLGLGSVSMIFAHLRILSGNSYSSWRPIR